MRKALLPRRAPVTTQVVLFMASLFDPVNSSGVRNGTGSPVDDKRRIVFWKKASVRQITCASDEPHLVEPFTGQDMLYFRSIYALNHRKVSLSDKLFLAQPLLTGLSAHRVKFPPGQRFAGQRSGVHLRVQ